MAAPQATVSSYGVIKGPMVEETYACFQAWDWKLNQNENPQGARTVIYRWSSIAVTGRRTGAFNQAF